MSGVEFFVILGAICAGAMVKSITGMGFPLIAVPVITLYSGLEDAVAIVAIPNAVANFVLWHGVRAAGPQTRDLSRLLGTGIVGAIVGTFALVNLPETPLVAVLVAAVAMFIFNHVRNPELTIGPETSKRWSPAVGFVAGMFQGAVGISGPIVVTWIHSYRLHRDAYIFSITAIFLMTGCTQLALLFAQGEMTDDRVLAGMLAVIPTLAMVPIGTRLRDRLGGPAFERVVLVVLVASVAMLIINTI